MYKSPFDIIIGEFEFSFENEVCNAVRNIGIAVDKEELLKALRYDRDQYNQGYKDAMAALVHCEECRLHGTCIVEDAFNTARMPDSKMFCAVGKRKIDNAEHCICCGEVIPEGRQVCPYCERNGKYV